MPRLELVPVSDSVLCVRRARYCSASYVVHEPDGVFLVDAGMEPDGSDLLAGLRHLGRDVREVRALLLTHWHNDHAAGADALRQLSGARVYVHEREQPWFEQRVAGPWRRRLSELLPEHGPLSALKALVGQAPPRAVRDTTACRDGELLEGRFRVLHTPGHTQGHASFLHLPTRTLFTGDAIAVCSGRLWYMSRFLTHDLATAQESMRAVAAVDSTAICPGHRGPLSRGLDEHRRRILARIDAGKPWPLLS